MRTTSVLVALLLTLTACSRDGGESSTTTISQPQESASETPSPSPSSAPQDGPPALPDGAVAPGRYRYVMTDSCDPAAGCRVTPTPSLPDVLVTVPDGWLASNEFHLIEVDSAVGTNGPDGAGLVMGWTSYWAGLNSQPCSSVAHQKPDIEVGPTVADFVDAVVAHPLIRTTEPKPVRLGRHRGQFFTLIGPSDIGDCLEWRPWDPSPYLQGPDNRWDLWVMDVDGVRVVVMAGYYPGTAEDTKAELRAMAESIRFVPAEA